MIGTWRQQQARQNFQDHLLGTGEIVTQQALNKASEAVIEVATTVKITREALDELIHSCPAAWETADEVRAAMLEGGIGFLTALGFEVVGQ